MAPSATGTTQYPVANDLHYDGEGEIDSDLSPTLAMAPT
jgi:hypothetical protein